jgi:hypothetical protein
MLIAIAIILFILIIASTWWFGLWSNLITLVNLLLAAMIATSIYEPVSDLLLSFNKIYRLLYDFIAIWLSFCLAFFILRAITDVTSSFRVKFDPITEMAGRSILSIWIAIVFICFSFFTLQLAPLKPNTYKQNVPKSEMGTIPDRAWLSFMQSRSRGALSAGTGKQIFKKYSLEQHPDDAGKNMRVFDPFSEFLPYHAEKRQDIADRPVLRIGS